MTPDPKASESHLKAAERELRKIEKLYPWLTQGKPPRAF